MTTRRGRSALLAAALLALAPSAVGAAALPAAAAETSGARPTEWCIPIIMPCHSSPSPTPSPSPSASASIPASRACRPSPVFRARAAVAVAVAVGHDAAGGGARRRRAGSRVHAAVGPARVEVAVVQRPARHLGRDRSLADGSRTTALKLEADRITISGFSLTVRRDTGPILTTTADTMTLDGHVAVYINSLSATLPGGKLLTLGADTPPPAEGLDSMFGVTLGLVGSTADSITYTNTVQHLSE
jgi:hypothetical protein